MQIGIVGLGKMGYNLALNLRNNNYEVIAQDVNEASVDKIGEEGGILGAYSLESLCNKLKGRKVVWLMVPSGEIVDGVIEELTEYLKPNDIIIDGGNSNFKDSVRRYNSLKAKQIEFLDFIVKKMKILSEELNGVVKMEVIIKLYLFRCISWKS